MLVMLGGHGPSGQGNVYSPRESGPASSSRTLEALDISPFGRAASGRVPRWSSGSPMRLLSASRSVLQDSVMVDVPNNGVVPPGTVRRRRVQFERKRTARGETINRSEGLSRYDRPGAAGTIVPMGLVRQRRVQFEEDGMSQFSQLREPEQEPGPGDRKAYTDVPPTSHSSWSPNDEPVGVTMMRGDQRHTRTCRSLEPQPRFGHVEAPCHRDDRRRSLERCTTAYPMTRSLDQHRSFEQLPPPYAMTRSLAQQPSLEQLPTHPAVRPRFVGFRSRATMPAQRGNVPMRRGCSMPRSHSLVQVTAPPGAVARSRSEGPKTPCVLPSSPSTPKPPVPQPLRQSHSFTPMTELEQERQDRVEPRSSRTLETPPSPPPGLEDAARGQAHRQRRHGRHRHREQEEGFLQASRLPSPARRPERPSTPREPVPKPDELGPGVIVDIDGSSFCITTPLGQGSFGVVWAAESAVHGEVAIKKMLCWSPSALADAEFEGELLRGFASAERRNNIRHGGAAPPSRLPGLIAQESEPMGEGAWRYWIAMTRLPGDQLSRYLEKNRHPTPQSAAESCRTVADACALAHALLAQMIPTFDQVGKVAYHRDATPRNILLDITDGLPHFSLIDFGLAVDATMWRKGASTAQQISIAGDGRYWPVSSWFAFEHGACELASVPGLDDEYKTRLDIHSLGLSAIQVIADLCPMLPQELMDPSDVVPVKLQQLLVVWLRYWKDATNFWVSIFKCFQERGDFDALKVAYLKAGVHEIIRKDLYALRAAIREARQACKPDASMACVVSLMDVLLVMISNGKEVDPPITWKRVRARLSEAPSPEVQVQKKLLMDEISPVSTTVPSGPLSASTFPSMPTSPASAAPRSPVQPHA